MSEGVKKCGTCGRLLPLRCFNRGSLLGTRQHRCRDCEREYRQMMKQRKKERRL